MATHKILYTQAALDDLDAIFDYVAIEDVAAARKLLSRCEQKIERLAEEPYSGAAIAMDGPELIAPGYRYVFVSPYLICYRVDGRAVHIGRILHGRKDWVHLLFQSRIGER